MNLTEDNSGFIRRLFLRHVRPGVTAQVVSTLGPIVCGIIAGTVYGKTGLAVVGLFAPFFFMAGFFGTIIASGSATLAAKYVAQNDDRRVTGIYTIALGLCLVCAVIIFIAGILFRGPVLSFLAGSGELHEPASRYYIPSLWYTCLTVIVYLPLFWARLFGKPSITMVLTFTLTGASILLGVVYSIGLSMELESLAIAQAIAIALAVFASLALLHIPKDGLRFQMPSYIRKDTIELISAGSAPGLSRLYRFLCLFLVNAVLLNVFGTEAVAVFGVLNMLLRFVTALSNGISGVQMPIASVLCEERDKMSLDQLARASFLFGNVVVFIFVVITLIFHRSVAAMFNVSGTMFYSALVLFCLYLPFYMNGSLFISWYTAVRRIKLANIIALAQDIVFPSLLVIFFAYISKAGSVWLHLPLSGILSLILLLLLRNLGKTDLSDSGTTLAFSVEREPEKASEASAAVGDFCEEQGFDRKQSMLLSMALEEMITLIAEQNPNGDNISVRLAKFEGGTVLRLRDTGNRFNPVEFYNERLQLSEDFEDSINLMGIKYITETAEIVYYKETFGVNNLVVII
ncbi:MAG: MATE family efflux transporter [Oscillospiraceae bacterium]|nr:MATE family efflux transporter [Oscillospiraceae bacterium]